MLFTGRSTFSAEYAEKVGLVNQVYDSVEELNAAAMDLAEEIAAQAPVAVAQAKESVNVGMQLDMRSALQYEINCLAYCFSTQDQKNAMHAFASKTKKPAFQNK
jgi:enoyl-CoA hydratase